MAETDPCSPHEKLPTIIVINQFATTGNQPCKIISRIEMWMQAMKLNVYLSPVNEA
jgi:hypothetical protein